MFHVEHSLTLLYLHFVALPASLSEGNANLKGLH